MLILIISIKPLKETTHLTVQVRKIRIEFESLTIILNNIYSLLCFILEYILLVIAFDIEVNESHPHETQTNGGALGYRFRVNGNRNVDAKITFSTLSTDRTSKYISKT